MYIYVRGKPATVTGRRIVHCIYVPNENLCFLALGAQPTTEFIGN